MAVTSMPVSINELTFFSFERICISGHREYSVISNIGSMSKVNSPRTAIKAAESNSILLGNLRVIASQELFICVFSEFGNATTFSFPISELMSLLLPGYRKYLSPHKTFVYNFYFYFEFV